MKIKWGVIGCGGIAYSRTIPGMMLSENSELVAVMDANLETAKKVKEQFGVKYALGTVEELLALGEIDAVYIASPVFCHKEQVRLAAEAKKHVLLEKPMGLTVEESAQMEAVCKANGVKLGVGLMMRFAARHQKIKEMISDGVIGKLVSMRAQFSCWYPDIPGAWRQNKALSGGGALMDMGIHCIDLLQYISGSKASSVACFAQSQIFDYSVDDFSALLMKMDNGAVAIVDTAFSIPNNAGRSRLEFYGTKGSILCEGTLGQTESGSVRLTASGKKEIYYEELEIEGVGNMYEKEISSFARAILNDTEPEVTAAEGIALQRIVEKAYLASDEGVYKQV